MPNSLPKDLRNLLARVTLEARDTAERAVRAALENLAVHEKDYRRHMSAEQRQLRNRLRARGRALGDARDERSGTQVLTHLAEDAAYEHWHRLLFTRFLAENALLHTDASQGNVPVTLQDCDELASELGARDGFDLACRFASEILPGVFRIDDPVFELTLAPNDQVELRKLLDLLPSDVFIADDALGWTYQFWQAKRKDEVNASGRKIGADELPAVTQLFTEDYMVEFLLHNTLGAWWAGKIGPIQAQTESEARAKLALPAKDDVVISWTYLRLIQNEQTKRWQPAAGTFDGWPKAAKEITFLDPCMGSGHFPVFVLPILARLRMEEEGLSAKKAVQAVLRDNIRGLELDPRCAQIGAFNVALTAWKLGGYQSLPSLHVACSGLALHTAEKDWVALAGENQRLQRGMERLYALFKDAPVLGSLINPRAFGGDLLEAEFHELQPLIEKALAQKSKAAKQGDLSAEVLAKAEMAVTARGLAKAAEILARQFTLVATNVPYLGRGKQNDVLKDFCERAHPDAKADLATCFVERCIDACDPDGSTALVTPQNWWFIKTYSALRQKLLTGCSFRFAATLGEEAWQSFGDRGPVAALSVITRSLPIDDDWFPGLNPLSKPSIAEKVLELITGELAVLSQRAQNDCSDHRISVFESSPGALLSAFARSYQGIKTGDDERACKFFWELSVLTQSWRPFQSSPSNDRLFAGMELVLFWGDEGAGLARRQGIAAWNRRGILLSQMRSLSATLYFGDAFAGIVSPLVVSNESHIPALWAYCSSKTYKDAVRKIDSRVSISNGNLVNVPFDLAHWQKVAQVRYPDGLPKPFSSDPTQWLFSGHPRGSDQPVHVAVARLLGYQWPRQTGSSFTDCSALRLDGLERLADADGIVCLPPINREQPAAHRLRALLGSALGQDDERALLAAAGAKGSKSTALEDWLRDEFFEQHCELFHQRPFIWHVWDGRKDGFHALVNCHKLDHATLQKLTYSYLGDWIRHQEDDVKADKPGADARLGAARVLQAELARILEGEAPYDVFVRWKPLAKQSVGWHPDLNDGVRMNIRPFMRGTDVGKKGAGLLRSKPNIKWDKDRGTEPERDKSEYPWFWRDEEPDDDPVPGRKFTGHRWNNVHLTLERKHRARGKS